MNEMKNEKKKDEETEKRRDEYKIENTIRNQNGETKKK
jgi:hypothetical protein